MDNYNILYELDQVARNASRPGQPFTTQAEHMPETVDIVKANGGPVDTCWSLSFMNSMDDALADKVDLNRMKYIIGTPNLINYTACHDNKRLVACLKDNLSISDYELFRRMKLAAIILTTSAGIPLIWQGDEMDEATTFDEKDENK
jgi:glycosidase